MLARAALLLIALTLTACSSGASTAPSGVVPAGALTHAGASPYAAYLRAQEAWLAQKTLGDGAIVYTDTEIEPYYANIAATGETRVRSKLQRVRNWMRWYAAHLNKRDRWGLSGTIYDYTYDARGREKATNSADSVDSYAATFFTLARALYDTNDAASQRYVESLASSFDVMGAMMLTIQQRDGMTIALPDYPVAYLMDNAEVYRGLRDLAYLEAHALHDARKAALYDRASARVAGGIASLWNAVRATYDQEKQEPNGPKTHARWTVWYPDATAQLFPVLQGVIPAQSPRGQALWAAFNLAYPRWDRLQIPDQFPWALVAATAAAEHDAARVDAYVQSVQYRFSPGFAWPWYDLEAGWYLQTLAVSGSR